jgi:hypothetical protein
MTFTASGSHGPPVFLLITWSFDHETRRIRPNYAQEHAHETDKAHRHLTL